MAKVLTKSRPTTPLPRPARAKPKKPGEKLTAVEHAQRRALAGSVAKIRRSIETQARKEERARATITKGLEQLFELHSVKPRERKVITKAMIQLLDGIAPHSPLASTKKKKSPPAAK